MKLFLVISLLLCLPLATLAQDYDSAPEANLPTTQLTPEITTRSIFPDRLATAVVYFDTIVDQPFFEPIENDSCRVVNVETHQTDGVENAQSAAVIHFQVKKAGIATLPSLTFYSDTKKYETRSVQCIASQPIKSDALSLTITPAKTQVYVGEPVRFDLTWHSSLQAPALQDLRLNPEFFENEQIQIAIPRNTDAENSQIGLPIGGRRVIATRTRDDDNPKALGTVTLPIYLRFTEAGTFELPKTKLEISKLSKPKSSFGQYVAHFNNSFFIPTDEQQIYQRLFTTSDALQIKVLPLPQNQQSQDFCGIFTPAEFSATIKPSNSIQIGQLLELEITIKTPTPSTFLELPKLSEQVALDERFLSTGDFGKVWHDGSTSFKQRIRILSTTIQSIPSLHYTLFNPESGLFETVSTPAIPLVVKSYENQDTISLKSLNATQVLLSNPEGIWYNYPKNAMNDLFQSMLQGINDFFWTILILTLTLTLLLIPVVREIRKRAHNPHYKIQSSAYKKFRRTPANSNQKWETFLAWLASHFHANQQAWTYSDTQKALREIQATPQDIETLAQFHKSIDKAMYTKGQEAQDFSPLNNIAKRLHKLLPALILGLLILCGPQTLSAATQWQQAETSFQDAQQQNDATLYAQAALQFEATAKENTSPASSWYNAGNAWFQAGELGRSIVAYRHALTLTPNDERIAQNLASARTLVANDVTLTESWWDKLPLITLKAFTLVLALSTSTLFLLNLRYQHKKLTKWTIGFAVILLTLLLTTSFKIAQQPTHGVITSNKVVAKKGPSYAYASAFANSLKDGLEFTLVETRDNWLRIKLQDKRECWIPNSQATLIH